MSRSLDSRMNRFGKVCAAAAVLVLMAGFVFVGLDKVNNSEASQRMEEMRNNPRPVLGDSLVIDQTYEVKAHEVQRDSLSSYPYYAFALSDSTGVTHFTSIPVEMIRWDPLASFDPVGWTSLFYSHDEYGRPAAYLE